MHSPTYSRLVLQTKEPHSDPVSLTVPNRFDSHHIREDDTSDSVSQGQAVS